MSPFLSRFRLEAGRLDLVNRAGRLHAMTEELRRAGERGRTADQLARAFEVTTRTVKRDISTLQASGSPIGARGGPGGGYVLVGQPTLPPVNFTAAQAVAIALALATNRDAPFAEDGRAALGKLLDVMDTVAREQVERLGAKVWVRETTESTAVIRRAVEDGVTRGRVVSLGYVDGDGHRSTRRVEPHMLAHTRGHWYLIGWCRTRDAPRWFRLDRVSDATVTTQPVIERDRAVFGEPPADAFAVAGSGQE